MKNMKGTLTTLLEANGFRQVSSSTAQLRLSQGTVKVSRWEKADEAGQVATVEVRQVDDSAECGTLQPGARRACAGISSADDLQKALDFHHIEITVITPQP